MWPRRWFLYCIAKVDAVRGGEIWQINHPSREISDVCQASRDLGRFVSHLPTNIFSSSNASFFLPTLSALTRTIGDTDDMTAMSFQISHHNRIGEVGYRLYASPFMFRVSSWNQHCLTLWSLRSTRSLEYSIMQS